MRKSLLLAGAFCTLIAGRAGADPSTLPNDKPFANSTGTSSSHSTLGNASLTQSFFQKLGANDRTCGTCHLPSDDWSVSASSAQKIFNDSEGLAALFQFDGQNVAGADLSTVEARRNASSLMINKALVRFNLTLPTTGAEFTIVASEGTYGNPVNATNLVVFRRILPTTNFAKLTTVLWDGRGNTIPNTVTPRDIVTAIFTGGTLLHAQATTAPPAEKGEQSSDLLFSLTSAQRVDNVAGKLDLAGALGGAANLTPALVEGAAGFDIFNAWASSPSADRKQIARGQNLFNNRTFPNGGRCSACHSVRNQGNNANGVLFNIGISDASRRTPDLPLYTLMNVATGATMQSSDPGLGITTGKWADIGKFKAPVLRGLAARAPYFHNGFAKDLEAVVNFYNGRFNIGLTDAEKADLVAFLRAL